MSANETSGLPPPGGQGGTQTQASAGMRRANHQEFQDLRDTYRAASSVASGQRYLVAMLYSRGNWTATQISEFLGLNLTLVGECIEAWNKGGMDGLRSGAWAFY